MLLKRQVISSLKGIDCTLPTCSNPKIGKTIQKQIMLLFKHIFARQNLKQINDIKCQSILFVIEPDQERSL